jgi:hypothetical protein
VSYLVEVLEHPHQNGGTYWAIEREVGFRPDGTVAWKWPTATNESDPRIWWAGKKEVDADPIRAAEFEHLWSAPIVQRAAPSLVSRIRSLFGR